MKPCFETADIDDAPELTAISIDAFHTDARVAGRSATGGPPGYDSIEFHAEMIKESERFLKILIGSRIIGGVWFNRENHREAYLYRLFIDPEFHRMGIGLETFKFLFGHFKDIHTWNLKVPVWNTRTPQFYKKLGFNQVNRSDRFLFFRYHKVSG